LNDSDNGSMRPDPEKTFDTREQAERARDDLNRTPPEYGHGPWYLGGPVEGKWSVIRWRGLMAEEIGDAKAYEEALREAFERVAMDHDFWRKGEGIRFDAVQLDGEYPVTRLVLLFRSVPQEPFGNTDVACVSGVGVGDPVHGVPRDRRACLPAAPRGPCDPLKINRLG
jgi:hypothetical protein